MKKNNLKILILLMSFALVGLVSLQIYWSLKTIEMERIKFDASIHRVLDNVVLKLEKKSTAKLIVNSVVSDSNKIVWVGNNKENDTSSVVFFAKTFNFDSDTILDTNSFEINVEVNTSDEKNDGNIVRRRIIRQTVGNKNNGVKIKSVVDTIIIKKEKLLSDVLEDMTTSKNVDFLSGEIDKDSLNSLIKVELKRNGINAEYSFGVVNKGDENVWVVKSNKKENFLSDSKYSQVLSPNDIFPGSLYLVLDVSNKSMIIFKSIWMMLALSLLFIGIVIFVFVKTVKMYLSQKKISEVKNDLINNITHEFKTPISAIGLAGEALVEPRLQSQSGAVEKYSKIITTENRKLMKLVETLLNTAALEKGEIELNSEKVDIIELINESISKARENKNDLNINFTHARIDSLVVAIDKFHFTNVLHNLIDNAIKYSKDNLEIAISVVIINDVLKISVKDNGIGIDKAEQSKIFDTFYRVSQGNRHDVKGNGVGLSYVKQIVEVHGGKIEVESKLGFGSEFRIVLPMDI